MPVTLREARQTLSRKLGGFNSGTVSLAPDTSDSLAQRSILSAKLYDADKGSKAFAGQFSWVGKYKDERRVRENGYRALPYVVYIPPTSGTYTITCYGDGTTDPINFNSNAATIQTAIQSLGGSVGSATVSQADISSPIVVALPDIIDIEISSGTIIATGGVGALEVNRAFTKALQIGEEWELHAKLPVEDADEIQGLNWIINFAARKLIMVDRFPITPIRNSLGTKQFIGLSGEDWLTDKKQIIAVYAPVRWQVDAEFTPPVSGGYTLTVDLGSNTYSTPLIAYNVTYTTVEDTLNDVLSGSGVTASVSSDFNIQLNETWFAQATISASAGTLVQAITMLQSPALYPNVWNFTMDGESPYIDNIFENEGHSLLVQAYRQSHSWVCPQASYGVLGSMWQSGDGMVDDYDQINISLDDLVAVAYAYACDQLASVGPGSDRGDWAEKSKRAHRVAAGIKLFDQQIEEKPRGGYGNSAWEAKGFF